ncbi:hypothetical protein PZH42_29925, partial [Bacteroides cellulosilyticus]|nr:hypothetical protein [Bacteroides cellulosilyticus]
ELKDSLYCCNTEYGSEYELRFLYPDGNYEELGVYPEEVFDESNNFENKEALWKHRYVVGGVSNQAWIMNLNDEQFYCPLTAFAAIVLKTVIHSGNKYEG